MNHEDRLIIFLSCLVSLVYLGMVIYLPSVPTMAQNLHASVRSVELTLTVYMLTFSLSQLVYGPLSDQFGRKPIIIFGLVLYIIFSIVSARAANIKILLFSRALEGLGAGGVTVLARAAVNDLFTGKALTKGLSYTSIAASLGVMLSPSVGSYLQIYFGWRSNFYFLAFTSLIFLAITLLWFKESKPPIKQEKSLLSMTLKRYKEVLSNKEYLLLALGGGLCFGGSAAYYVASPIIYQHVLHVSPTTYAHFFILTSSCYIIGGLMNNWFFQYERARLITGSILILIAPASMIILGIFKALTVLHILLPMALYMFAIGILFPTTMIVSMRLLKPLAGTAAAVNGCSQIFASALGTAIVAHLPQNNQIPMALVLLLFALGTAILLLPIMCPWCGRFLYNLKQTNPIKGGSDLL